MKDRIQEILNSQNLTRTQLAGMLNIQASAITHIINGRNKPSMDVVQSILTAFPKISPDWLILGLGNMYRNDTPQTVNQPITIKSTKNEPFMPSLFDGLTDDGSENSTYSELSQDAQQTIPEAPQKPTVEKLANVAHGRTGEYGRRAESPVVEYAEAMKKEPDRYVDDHNQQKCPPVPQQKSITKIIIFYSDNTFEEMCK